jgi:DNA-binding transcriptional MerR regulator
LDISLSEIRQLLEFTAAPDRSCAQVDALLDAHIAQVQRRLEAMKALRNNWSRRANSATVTHRAPAPS